MSSLPSCCFTLCGGHIPKWYSRTPKIDWMESNPNNNNDDDNTYIDESTTDAVLHDSNDTTTSSKNNKKNCGIKTSNKHVILMEIVGAMCLETKQRKKVDPYCIVKQQQQQINSNTPKDEYRCIHRTDTIANDGNPIWTIQTKSLCLIEIPILYDERMVDEMNCATTVTSSSSSSISETILDTSPSNKASHILIEIYHGNAQMDAVIKGATTTVTSPLLDFISTSTTQIVKTTTDIATQLQLPQQQLSSKLGYVEVPYRDILQYCSNNNKSDTDRIEYAIQAPSSTCRQQQHASSLVNETASIALRFRFATEWDILFMDKLKSQGAASVSMHQMNNNGTGNILTNLSSVLTLQSNIMDDEQHDAADINFRYVKKKQLTLSYRKIDADGIEKFRVIPYPDPKRIETTTWMSAAEMERTTYEPSTKWVTAGGGTLGTMYCEILGCNNLPQMDKADLSQTDPVVTMTYEDNFVRTDVIWDQIYPRWMPWTTRAFQFNIRHPASILCIAVFDCDENVFDRHDPIGRVVIQPSSLKQNCTHILHYALQDDPNEVPTTDSAMISEEEEEDNISSVSALLSTNLDEHKMIPSRGTIIVRLRIEWDDECLAMKMCYSVPPRFIINVDNEKAYEVLTYTTRGIGYMHTVSIQSVKLLFREVMEYGSRFCFVLDVLLEILLWRGQIHITKSTSIWFPIHSVVLFVGAVTLIERPDLILPISLYGVSWILLSVNYHNSRHPNPWLRIPSYLETLSLTVLGRRISLSSKKMAGNVVIAANQGSTGSMRQEKLDEMKAARMSLLIQTTLAFLLKVYYIYSKTGNKAIKITTDRTNQWNILSNKLKYIHMLLLYMCQYLRLGRNFISWRSSYTSAATSYCLLIATAWCILPVSTVVHWLVRFLVYTFLGPCMKWIDIRYVRKWYATKEELLERIRKGDYNVQESDLPDFDSFLQNKTVNRMIHLGRVKAEELYKLRDMRQLLFGQYSELIPFVDNSRYPSIPLPQSTAIQTTEWNVPEASEGYHVPGQLLSGNMILSMTSNASDDK